MNFFWDFPFFPLVSIIVTIACWSIMMAALKFFQIPTPGSSHCWDLLYVVVFLVLMVFFIVSWRPLLSSSFLLKGSMRARWVCRLCLLLGPATPIPWHWVTGLLQVEEQKFSSLLGSAGIFQAKMGHCLIPSREGVRSDSPKPQCNPLQKEKLLLQDERRRSAWSLTLLLHPWHRLRAWPCSSQRRVAVQHLPSSADATPEGNGSALLLPQGSGDGRWTETEGGGGARVQNTVSSPGACGKVLPKRFLVVVNLPFFIPRPLPRRGNSLFLELFWSVPPGDSVWEVSAVPCPGFMGSISKAKGLIRVWSLKSPSCQQPVLPLFRDRMSSLLHPVILDLGGKGLVHLVKLEIFGLWVLQCSLDDPDASASWETVAMF